MNPEKVLLVDSDTLVKWVFPDDAGGGEPVIRYEDIPIDVQVYVGFPTVADLYSRVRWRRDRLAGTKDAESAARIYSEGMAALGIWFSEHLFVLHSVDANLSQRWLDLVNEDPVHESANREHAWMVAMAQYLRDNRRSVQIASEEGAIYLAYADKGHLAEIGIHGVD